MGLGTKLKHTEMLGPRRKVRGWALLGSLLGLTLVGGLALATRFSAQNEFQGTELDPPLIAEGFALHDQHGQVFDLSEARGKIVVVTFLYTSCTDVCPFMGAKMGRAANLLGDRGEQVEFVAVTTDPERDTPDRVIEYSRTLGMLDRWHYLLGSRAELEPLWEAYFVGTERSDEKHPEISEEQLQEFGLLRGLMEGEIQSAREAIDLYGGGYDVGHSTPLWLIDRSGQIVVLHGQDFLPTELANDIRILLNEDF